MDDTLRRIPPHNLDAERNLLSLLINFPDKFSEVATELKKEHFYKRVHQDIYECMRTMDLRRENWDEVVLGDSLKNAQSLKDAGGEAYLARLTSITPNFNHMNYARLIIKKSRLRKLIDISNQLLSRSYSEEEDADTLVAEAEKEILKVAELRDDKKFMHASHFGSESWDSIARLVMQRQAGETPATGFKTMFRDFDELTLGLKRQDMVVLGARPSVGKTAFCLQLAHNIAVTQTIPVILYSLEMPGTSIVNRLFSNMAGINGSKLAKGDLSSDEITQLGMANSRLQNSSLFVNDQNAMTLMDIKNDLRRLQRSLRDQNQELGVVIIDYLQLIQSYEAKNSEQEKISEISRGLKGIAREFDCTVLALSQLSRKVEGRQDKRPMLSDLRESGAIEQDADIVMFLHREEYYDPGNEENRGKAEVIVAKNRNGPIGSVSLFFDKHLARFRDLVLQQGKEIR
ncbi:MAG: replicative DNA helicase [Candidatus Cloacimonetes bacterium]|nr:replicative DNA helicase [Candidatus Cloacimonadota bacterium]